MKEHLKQLMANKSDEDLLKYVTNPEKYTQEAIDAALQELGSRGHIVSSDDRQRIEKATEAKKYAADNPKRETGFGSWKENIVNDEDAPQCYSQRAIWGFSVFFTVIFGAILLAINIADKTKKWIVIGFGIAYTSIAIFVLNQFPRNTGLTFIVNALGAIILTTLFWNKYIGTDTKYRIKPIWKPLIISIIIATPFLIAAIMYSE